MAAGAAGRARVSIETLSDIDCLAARGAGFHNDVSRHWSRCLFWLPALDLLVAEFDERSGAIQRLRALRDSMKRHTCQVDEPTC